LGAGVDAGVPQSRRRHARPEGDFRLARLRRPPPARSEPQDESAPPHRQAAGGLVPADDRLRLQRRSAARHGADLDVQRVSRKHAHRAVAQPRFDVSQHDAAVRRGRKAAMEQMTLERPAAETALPYVLVDQTHLDLTAARAASLALSFAPSVWDAELFL